MTDFSSSVARHGEAFIALQHARQGSRQRQVESPSAFFGRVIFCVGIKSIRFLLVGQQEAIRQKGALTVASPPSRCKVCAWCTLSSVCLYIPQCLAENWKTRMRGRRRDELFACARLRPE